MPEDDGVMDHQNKFGHDGEKDVSNPPNPYRVRQPTRAHSPHEFYPTIVGSTHFSNIFKQSAFQFSEIIKPDTMNGMHMSTNTITAAEALRNTRENELSTETVLKNILDTITMVSHRGSRIAHRNYYTTSLYNVDFETIKSELTKRGFDFKLSVASDRTQTTTRW